MLIAGEKGGDLARTAYQGLGFAFLYALLQKVLRFIAEAPELVLKQTNRYLPSAIISGEITPEYMGVGYIIGPQICGSNITPCAPILAASAMASNSGMASANRTRMTRSLPVSPASRLSPRSASAPGKMPSLT